MKHTGANYRIYNGDCLDILPKLPAGRFDAVITDIPYGTTACKWDAVIPFDTMWTNLKRLVKPNSPIVLFGKQPFSSLLVGSNLKEFRYTMAWDKKFSGSFALAKVQPMMTYEDIHIFGTGRLTYNPQMVPRDNPIKGGGMTATDLRPTGTIKVALKKTYTEKYPTTVLHYPRDLGRTVHPTQKPVALMEYLIKTYTNEGGLVLDFTMGSGTTGVAALNCGRKFVGIELQPEYYEIAKSRIEAAEQQPEQLAA